MRVPSFQMITANYGNCQNSRIILYAVGFVRFFVNRSCPFGQDKRRLHPYSPLNRETLDSSRITVSSSATTMSRDVSACNTYNYGDAMYWDARYIQEADSGSFDWYQRYSALRPFIRKYISTSSRVLMVGCGNAVISEDMIKDGFQDIMNIDISSVVIEMMKRRYEDVPQLKYMQMDVKDMSFFPDDSFDSVIDKGTLDSLLCGTNAPISSSLMLAEVSRLLKPGGVYILITYGDPTVRMPHINRSVYNWHIELYIIPRPGFQRPAGLDASQSHLDPVPVSEKGLLPADYVMEDPDSHYIYACTKIDGQTDLNTKSANFLNGAVPR